MTHELNRFVLSVTGLEVSISVRPGSQTKLLFRYPGKQYSLCTSAERGELEGESVFLFFCVQNDLATTGQIRVDMYQLPYDSSTSVANPHKYAEKRISNWPVSINKPFFLKKKKKKKKTDEVCCNCGFGAHFNRLTY